MYCRYQHYKMIAAFRQLLALALLAAVTPLPGVFGGALISFGVTYSGDGTCKQ